MRKVSSKKLRSFGLQLLKYKSKGIFPETLLEQYSEVLLKSLHCALELDLSST